MRITKIKVDVHRGSICGHHVQYINSPRRKKTTISQELLLYARPNNLELTNKNEENNFTPRWTNAQGFHDCHTVFSALWPRKKHNGQLEWHSAQHRPAPRPHKPNPVYVICLIEKSWGGRSCSFIPFKCSSKTIYRGSHFQNAPNSRWAKIQHFHS